MEILFAYEKPAEGAQFIDRKEEIARLFKCIKNKKKAVVYGSPKTGKESLVKNVYESLKRNGYRDTKITIDLFNIRTKEQFLDLYEREIIPIFERYNILSPLPLNIDINNISQNRLLDLPDLMNQHFGLNILIYFKEFQNILFFDEGEKFMECFAKILNKHNSANYIFTGSCINRMKYIFKETEWFSARDVEMIQLASIESKPFTNYIISTFQRTGRVIEQDMADEIYAFCKGHPWYTQHFASICYDSTIGYINTNIINHAKESLIYVHDAAFKETICELTINQINFLKAINDNVTRFCSADILEQYNLISSAHVARVKDSLLKKEIITVDDDGSVFLIDPIFEYWLKYYYFL
ncbi:MAG: ATP-binding protein [Bacteroidales bacterium]|nr:ATP-binding protein [Bacteroidales bacterium]